MHKQQLTRDNFCLALQTLYGCEPADFDGLTLAELSQHVSLKELGEVYTHLGLDNESTGRV